jgi:hypothetical protein
MAQGSTRYGAADAPLPSGRHLGGFTSRVARCAAPAAHAARRRPLPFNLGPNMGDFPSKAKGASFTGSWRYSSRSLVAARAEIGKCRPAEGVHGSDVITFQGTVITGLEST